MLEKNSQVQLTEDDLRQYNAGVVSERIKQTWGIETIEELSQLMSSSNLYNSNHNQG